MNVEIPTDGYAGRFPRGYRDIFDPNSADQEARAVHPAVESAAEWIADHIFAPTRRAPSVVDDGLGRIGSSAAAALQRGFASALSRGPFADVLGVGDGRNPERKSAWAARSESSSSQQPGRRTLEYTPERDEPDVLPLVQFVGDKIRFRPFHGVTVPDGRGGEYELEEGAIKADNGTVIKATRNVNGPSNLDANAHGFTFARGKVTIDADQVPLLLKNDGYCEVRDSRQVRPGDVVVYWDDGYAVHSARVVDVRNGSIVVEGKYGWSRGTVKSTVERQWPPPSELEAKAKPRFYSKRCEQPRVA